MDSVDSDTDLSTVLADIGRVKIELTALNGEVSPRRTELEAMLTQLMSDFTRLQQVLPAVNDGGGPAASVDPTESFADLRERFLRSTANQNAEKCDEIARALQQRKVSEQISMDEQANGQSEVAGSSPDPPVAENTDGMADQEADQVATLTPAPIEELKPGDSSRRVSFTEEADQVVTLTPEIAEAANEQLLKQLEESEEFAKAAEEAAAAAANAAEMASAKKEAFTPAPRANAGEAKRKQRPQTAAQAKQTGKQQQETSEKTPKEQPERKPAKQLQEKESKEQTARKSKEQAETKPDQQQPKQTKPVKQAAPFKQHPWGAPLAGTKAAAMKAKSPTRSPRPSSGQSSTKQTPRHSSPSPKLAESAKEAVAASATVEVAVAPVAIAVDAVDDGEVIPADGPDPTSTEAVPTEAVSVPVTEGGSSDPRGDVAQTEEPSLADDDAEVSVAFSAPSLSSAAPSWSRPPMSQSSRHAAMEKKAREMERNVKAAQAKSLKMDGSMDAKHLKAAQAEVQRLKQALEAKRQKDPAEAILAELRRNSSVGADQTRSPRDSFRLILDDALPSKEARQAPEAPAVWQKKAFAAFTNESSDSMPSSPSRSWRGTPSSPLDQNRSLRGESRGMMLRHDPHASLGTSERRSSSASPKPSPRHQTRPSGRESQGIISTASTSSVPHLLPRAGSPPRRSNWSPHPEKTWPRKSKGLDIEARPAWDDRFHIPEAKKPVKKEKGKGGKDKIEEVEEDETNKQEQAAPKKKPRPKSRSRSPSAEPAERRASVAASNVREASPTDRSRPATLQLRRTSASPPRSKAAAKGRKMSPERAKRLREQRAAEKAAEEAKAAAIAKKAAEAAAAMFPSHAVPASRFAADRAQRQAAAASERT